MKKLITTSLLGLAFVGILILLARLTAAISTEEPKIPEPPKPEPQSKRKLIIVGEAWAPFEYPDSNEVKGIDAEVLDHIFKKLDVDYEIRFYPWPRAWMTAKKGEADAVISISYKKSREEYLFYTDSQRRFGETGEWPAEFLWGSEYVFFIRQIHQESFRFESFEQLKKDGYRMVTIQDYSYSSEFQDAGFESIKVPDQDAAYRMLAEGKADIFPNERTVGLAALKRLGLQDKITFSNKPLFRKPYLLPFCRKSDYPEKEKLMREVYHELNTMRANGAYEKIYNKYIPKNNAPEVRITPR